METFRRCLSEKGAEVRLVVPRYGQEDEETGIVRVPGRPMPGDPEDRLVNWSAFRRAVMNAAADCDVVHVQTPFLAHYAGLAAARAHRLPVMATYHTLFEEYLQHYLPHLPTSWLKAQARAFPRRQCNALDGIVVPSSAMAERLRGYGVQTPLHVLPTGIALEQFKGGDGRAFRYRHGILSYRPIALYVGRLAHEKTSPFCFKP